jgi:hypothetical protein
LKIIQLTEIREILAKIWNIARARFFVAISAAVALAAAGVLFVKIDTQSKGLENVAKDPSIKLVCGNSTLRYRATDAFFIPTRYGAKYRVNRPKISEHGEHRSKPIFSELDKIRIFNVFLKNFSESEYWVVSRINLRPPSGKNLKGKSFIAAADRNFTADYGLKKFYDCDAQILFKDEPNGR